jgi:hypothetical protein
MARGHSVITRSSPVLVQFLSNPATRALLTRSVPAAVRAVVGLAVSSLRWARSQSRSVSHTLELEGELDSVLACGGDAARHGYPAHWCLLVVGVETNRLHFEACQPGSQCDRGLHDALRL